MWFHILKRYSLIRNKVTTEWFATVILWQTGHLTNLPLNNGRLQPQRSRCLLAFNGNLWTVLYTVSRSQNCEERLLAPSYLVVRPSNNMKKCGSHWTDFREILYLSILRKFVAKIQVSLKSCKKNWYVTLRAFLITSRPVLFRMRNVSDKSCIENQNTHFVFSNFFFFLNRSIYEIMFNNIVELGRPQMKIWRMCIACWIPKATKLTLRLCNTHCFSTATMVAQTRLNVTLYVLYIACLVALSLTVSHSMWNCNVGRLCSFSESKTVTLRIFIISFYIIIIYIIIIIAKLAVWLLLTYNDG
jgi:hypothetical protein